MSFFFSTIVFIAAIVSSHPAMAATYYVATSGSDSNPGTQAQPFRNIQRAADTVVAGDTVLVRGGSYVEEINLRRSGTASAKITFKPEPGSGAVFLKHPSTTKPHNTAVFQAFDIGHNRIEGFYFKDSTTDKQIQFYATNPNIDFITVHTPVVGNQIVNNTFDNVGNNGDGGAAYLGAIVLSRSQDSLVEGNLLTGVYGMGITPYATYRDTIRRNTIINMRGATHYGDTWYQQNGHAIWLAGGIMGDGGWSPGNPGRLAGYNIIEENVIDGTATSVEASALRCDTGGHNNTWRRNIVKNLSHDRAAGIFMESSCSNNLIQENIVFNSNRGFDTSSPWIDWTQYNTWINNVAYNNRVGFAIIKARLSTYKNNISFNNTRAQVIVTSLAVNNGNTFSNNLWYKTGSSTVGVYHGANGTSCIASQSDDDCINNRTDNLTLAQWNAASGEIGSISANPQFVSLTSGAENFRLQPSSPAIGKGVGGVNMGAYPTASPSSSPPPPDPISSSEHTAEAAGGSKTIDANASDWNGVANYPIAEVCPTCVSPVASDLAASFRVAWNNTYLYILAEISDNEVDLTGASEIYEHDGIEVMIDGLRDRASSYGSDDHQIFIQADGVTAAAGHTPGDGKIIAATRQLSGGYIIEAAVRWDFIGGNPPSDNQLYGFSVAVNDRDNETRESQLLWKYAPDHWQDTSGYGDLKLLSPSGVISAPAAPINLTVK